MGDNVHSFGKSFGMLLRAIINIIAFTALFYFCSIGNFIFSIVSGIVLVLCVIVNLILPFIHRVK